MNSLTIQQLTVPLAEYATISDKATLYDAILELEQARRNADQAYYRHRAVLVFDERDQVIGKLGLFDILMALESTYSEIPGFERLTGMGLAVRSAKDLFSQYSIWNKPLETICQEAADLRVRDVMYKLTEDEYIEETASIDEAIHQLIMGRHQSLLVTRDNEIIGILKLSDIFQRICALIKSCEPPQKR